MSMSRREIEKMEAAAIRHDLKKFIEELNNKELIEFNKFRKDYKKIYNLFNTIKELLK